MNNHNSDTKKIFKNTIVLYIRMFVVMLISLYSSRVVLAALGVDDFGLYNVVGGVVALFSFLKSSLTASTQRFLSFELGKTEDSKIQSVFSISVTTHIIVSIIIVLLAETIGLWFLNAKINIPEGREFAANVIYQLSVLSLVLGMLTVPYNAVVISHEKMGFFAFVGVVESVLKLVFALLLFYGKDKLIMYGVFIALINMLILGAYWIYCRLHFFETKYHFVFNKTIFRDIFSFSGWTILGQMAVIAVNYGTNILVNMFYTVAANAAMGIAQQVNGALTGLTSNFQTAFQPQITKSYASKDYDYLKTIIYYASKISFFLLFIVTFPIMLNIDAILKIWLTTIPDNTNSFCILFIVASIFNAISTPLWISVFATGKIRTYQIVVSAVFFSDLIIVYGLFSLGFPPVTCMIVKASINFFVIFVRLFFTRKEVEGFSTRLYLKNTLIPCMLSALLTIAPIVYAFSLVNSFGEKLLVTCLGISLSVLLAYFVGLKRRERVMFRKYMSKFFNKQ